MPAPACPDPGDTGGWDAFVPHPDHRDSFLQSAYFATLVSFLMDETTADAGKTKLLTWSIDARNLNAKAMQMAIALLECDNSMFGSDAHVAFVNTVKTQLDPDFVADSGEDEDGVKSCNSVENSTQQTSTKNASEGNATDTPVTAQPAADGPTQPNTDDAPPGSDDETAAGDAEEPPGQNEKKKHAKKLAAEKKAAAKLAKSTKADKGAAVGKHANTSKPDPAHVTVEDNASYIDTIRGTAAKVMAEAGANSVVQTESTPQSDKAKAVSTFRASVPSKESIDVAMIELPIDVAAKAGLPVRCLPSATKPNIQQLVELSATRGCDFAYREDVMVNCGSALLTASQGHMKGKLDRAGTIVVVRSGLKAQYVILRDIHEDPQTTPIDQRIAFLQTVPGLELDQITPNSTRAFITGEAQAMQSAQVISINRMPAKKNVVGPTDLVRAVGHCDGVSKSQCLVCPQHLLGDKRYCARRVRVQLKHKAADGSDLTDRGRVAIGLEFQQMQGVAGVYLAGKDLVIILDAPAVDTDVAKMKAHASVFRVWCEVRPVPLQARINKMIPSTSEITCISKPDAPDTMVVEVQLGAGPDMKDADWRALAAVFSGTLRIGNFDAAQLHIPNNIYQQHSIAQEHSYKYNARILTFYEKGLF